MGRRSTYTFLQRRHTDGQKAHEKMFILTNYQRNTNQNYNEESPGRSQSGHCQKNLQTIERGEGVSQREPSYTLDGDTNWFSSHYREQSGAFLKHKNGNAGFYGCLGLDEMFRHF